MKIHTPARSTVPAEIPQRPTAPVAAPEAAPAAAAAGWSAKKATAGAAAAPVDGADRARGVAEQYFKALATKDIATLQTMYRPDAKFHDNMFDLTKGESIVNMWKKSPPLGNFKSEILSASATEVHAKWTCDYEMFGHKVHNEIDSVMKLDANGKIVEQRENWDPKKWMKQALPAIPSWAQGIAYALMRPILSASMGG